MLPQTATEMPETDSRAVVAAAAQTTRTTMDNTRAVLWSAGDQIRIFGATAPRGAVYTTQSDNTRTGIFLPVSGSAGVSDETRYAVYPATAVEKASLSGTELEIDLSGLADQPYNPALGAGADVAKVPMVAMSTDQNFSFKNICGGIRFQLVDYQDMVLKIKTVSVSSTGGEQIAGTVGVDLATAQPTLRKGSGAQSVTIDCGDGANIASGGDLTTGSGFIAFLPAGEYAGLRFVVTDTDGRVYEAETKQAVKVAPGIVTPLRLLPLTLYWGTANCYRTSGSGTVEIDVTPYYTFSETYVHEGRKCVDASGRAAGVPAKAQIVWQQAASNESGDVVSAPTLDGATLKVPATGTKGNALVAVCDVAGTILWSYHVWVSEVQDLACNFEQAGAFRMMDRNLGATSTVSKDRNAYGLFYQWGRKDPFARNLTAARPTGKPYQSATSDLEKTETATKETGTIAYANRHPQTRLLSANEWYTGAGGNDRLWGDAEGGPVKTVYDPCPEGYCVPGVRHVSEFKFTSKAECDANYGLLLAIDGQGTTSYFPTTGYLEGNADGMFYLEYRGYLWLNAGGTEGNRLYVNNAAVNVKHEPHTKGMAVRCVKIGQ